MLTMTSRQVQTHYGEFIEASRDRAVCVTRHGRPVFYAVPVREYSPEYLWGQVILAQQDRAMRDDPSGRGQRLVDLMDALPRKTDAPALSEDEVMAFVKENRV